MHLADRFQRRLLPFKTDFVHSPNDAPGLVMEFLHIDARNRRPVPRCNLQLSGFESEINR